MEPAPATGESGYGLPGRQWRLLLLLLLMLLRLMVLPLRIHPALSSSHRGRLGC